MLLEKVVNDWDEVTFVPTITGKILLAAVIIGLLALATFFSTRSTQNEGKSKSVLTVKQLAFCALAIALATVLSNIKVFRFPTGGAITLLSMLVACLPGFFFGIIPGIITGVAYGFLQMLIDPYILFPSQMIVDYILAFGALGLSGLFCYSKYGLIKGYIAAILGRFVFATISGWIFFGAYAWEGWNPLPYSLVYNAIYIFAEGAITLIIICIPAIRKAISTVKEMANA